MANAGKNRGGKKVANRLVAAGSAAVLAVYAAGYTRTRAAAEKLDGQVSERRSSGPRPAQITSPIAPLPIVPPATPAPVIDAVAKADPKPTLVASAKLPAAGARLSSAPDPVSTPAPVKVADPAPAPAAIAAAPVSAPAPVVVPPPPVQPAAPADPLKAIVAAAAPPWKDGTYDGWGTCRHGDLQATVVIKGGKITSAEISQCLTRYSCDIIDKLPPQVIQRQSPDVSYISGATQSTDAYYWAIISALGKAK